MLLWFAAAGLPVSPQTDPLATLDPFKELSEHELHTRWSHNADSPSQANTQEDNPHDPSPSLSSRLRELQSFSETSYVDVRLAGFSSDGEGEISLPEDTLQALLDATLHSERQHVLFPPYGEAHGLPVYRRFVYRVSTAPPGLIARVVRQISVYRKSDGSLPVRAVDSMVREDFERGRGSHITLYLLNPRLALAEGSTASSPNATRAQHRYIDDADSAECSVVNWVGSGRYMWVDLSAGPVAYGRAAQAEGVVNAHAIPSVGRLARVFGGKEEVARQLAVELAVFVKTSSRFLLAPPLAWRQEQPYTSVAVSDDDAFDSAPHLDTSPIKAELQKLSSQVQRINVETVNTSFVECKLCAAAYAAALKTSTSIAKDEHGKSTTSSQPYLDARSLREWLLRFRDDLPGLSGRVTSSWELLLPVFVFSLSSPSLLLLDGTEQAVPFSDVVLSVTSSAQSSQRQEQCDGKPIALHADRVLRPMLAAILQTGWKLSAPYTSWSEAHGSTVTNLLWAVGPSPFGPYSSQIQLSFALRDSAIRSGVHALAADLLGELASLRSYFREWGKEVDDVLGARDHLSFLRRLNVFSFKLQRAQSYLSLHNFNTAVYYLRSSSHDLRAMREILQRAGRSLRTQLICFE